MKWPLLLLCLVSLSFFGKSASAQVLWNDTAIGMTPEAVRGVVEAVEPAATFVQTSEGFKALGVRVAGQPSDIEFKFDVSGLTQVSVLISGPDFVPNGQVDVIYGAVVNRYNSPLACEALTLLNKRCIWSVNGTTVEGTFIHGPAGRGFALLIYSAASPSNL